ncbi:MAG: CdaR family protein [Anaerolineae bacterium]
MIIIMEKETFRNFVNRLGSFFLALILAVIVWVVAVNEENPSRKSIFPESIPIEFLNKPKNMVIFGNVVDRVRLTVQAPQNSWENLRSSSFQAWVDLKDLSADIHDLEVKVKCSDSAVKIIEKNPARISVRLEEIEEKQVDVRINIMDSAPLGYFYRTPAATPAKVKAFGPKSLVGQVVVAAADIYLRNAKSTLEETVKLAARDELGNTIAGVEFDPPQVKVQVPIEQRLGYKDVSVRVILKGQVASGYRISNVSVEPSVITIVGSPAALNEVPGYLETALLDVSGASADVVERITLNLPPGVSILGGQQGVMVKVDVTPLEGGLTMERELTVEGLGPGLKATPSPNLVDVILSGPMPRLDTLKPEEIQVILNLFDLGPGTHKVTPHVLTPEGIRVESILPETIEVVIEKLPTPYPTATPGFT